MRLLAFDTSTDLMSVAVGRTVDGASRVWQHSGPGAAQASASLIPCIMELMGQAALAFGELDAIVFGRGPGAFTGLRTACSVAQGLGFGAHVRANGQPVPVLPVDSLLALAEQARAQVGGTTGLRVQAMLDARMGEVYWARYVFDGALWRQQQDYRLDRPQDMVFEPGWLLAGNVFAAGGDDWPAAHGLRRVEAVPTAAAMLRLAPALLAAGHAVSAEQALPTYVRDKVAQTSAERAAAKTLVS